MHYSARVGLVLRPQVGDAKGVPMSAETPRVMQNPGDLRPSDGTLLSAAKKVTLIPIPIAGVLVEWTWPPRILWQPTISQEDEKATLVETTR